MKALQYALDLLGRRSHPNGFSKSPFFSLVKSFISTPSTDYLHAAKSLKAELVEYLGQQFLNTLQSTSSTPMSLRFWSMYLNEWMPIIYHGLLSELRQKKRTVTTNA